METGLCEPSAAFETQPELEAQQNLFARIGNTVRNGYDHARDNIKTYAAIGTASLTLAGAELTTATEPVAADNVPAPNRANALPRTAPEVGNLTIDPATVMTAGSAYLTFAPLESKSEANPQEPLITIEKQPTAQATSVVDDCVTKELVKPKVVKANIRSPGTKNQTNNVMIEVGPTPEECRPLVQRLVQFELVVKQLLRINGQLRHITVRLARWSDSNFTRNEDGPLGVAGVPNPHNPLQLVQCSVGSAVTRAIVGERIIVTDLATNKEAGRHVWRQRATIGSKYKKPC